jgi:Holliday junction resolvase RusA-like endonuclease
MDADLLRIVVPGHPLPMPQGKVVYRPGLGRHIRLMPDNIRAWQNAIGTCALLAIREFKASHPRAQFPMRGPLLVGFQFFRSKPKHVPIGCDQFPAQRPDLENYEELVADALTGIVYHDDSQIIGHFGFPFHAKLYAGDLGERTVILAMPLKPVDLTLGSSGFEIIHQRTLAKCGMY